VYLYFFDVRLLIIPLVFILKLSLLHSRSEDGMEGILFVSSWCAAAVAAAVATAAPKTRKT
jgi:hypothetical protein